MRRDGFHSNNPRRPLRTRQERRRAECSLAHGKALPAAKPPLARRCAASRADPLAIGRDGRPLHEGSGFFLKPSQPSGEIRNDRKRGRMCSPRARSASLARLDRTKRLVAEFASPVSRSATAHSTAFSVICGLHEPGGDRTKRRRICPCAWDETCPRRKEVRGSRRRPKAR